MALDLDRLISTTVDSGASDLILKTGSQPSMKQVGKIPSPDRFRGNARSNDFDLESRLRH